MACQFMTVIVEVDSGNKFEMFFMSFHFCDAINSAICCLDPGSLSDDGSLPSPGMNNREMNFAELTSTEYDSPDIIDIKPRPCDDDDELADLRSASDGQTVPLVVLADQSTVKRHPSLLQAVAASLSSKSLSPASGLEL